MGYPNFDFDISIDHCVAYYQVYVYSHSDLYIIYQKQIKGPVNFADYFLTLQTFPALM